MSPELSPAEWAALSLSLKVAFWCTLASLLPGIAVAWLLARREFPGKAVLDALVHLPMVLPPVVPGYLLLLLFGHNGAPGRWLHDTFGISLVFDWKGAVLASAVMGFPLLVQPVRLAIQMIDRRLERSAATLGARPLDVFLSVTLPLALPGILVGALLSFSRSLGEFGATITFVGNIEGETRTLPLAIYSSMHAPDGDAMALRLVTLSLTIAFVSLLVSNHLSKRAAQRLGYERHADA
ncbi:MAG: molybdate ABC transporter permease subunit [Pseudomonadota bacterium]